LPKWGKTVGKGTESGAPTVKRVINTEQPANGTLGYTRLIPHNWTNDENQGRTKGCPERYTPHIPGLTLFWEVHTPTIPGLTLF